jgi:heat shock protein HslJ
MTLISVGTFSNRLLFISLTCPGMLSVANAQSPLRDFFNQKEGIEHRLTRLVIAGEEKSLPAQPIITLKIVSDGLLGGNSGVNSYFGGFKVDDAGHVQWSKPGFAVTLMAGPEDLMNLEQQFLGALQSTQLIRVLGRGLIFETEDSATRLTFEEVNQEEALANFLGKKLVLARMITGGRETALPTDPQITLLLTSDGRASGNSGVNSYKGSYKLLPHDGIDFSKAFATTRMAGLPELMNLENSFLNALSVVEVVHFTAGGVTFENNARTIVLEFVLPPTMAAPAPVVQGGR